MLFYLAPLEEVTGYPYRRVFLRLFGGIDRYFTPFLSPTQKRGLKRKDLREVAPDHNQGLVLTPQILTNRADQFRETALLLDNLGYKEVNLNLGCPSGTVVPKHKGSGFLADLDALDAFFEDIFRDGILEGRVSVKTRLGLSDPEEFHGILQIYNRYPLSEVILHPRVQKDFYKNRPNLEAFGQALAESAHPLCYNGDIRSVEDMETMQAAFPPLNRVMIGRGLVADPALVRQLQGGPPLSPKELEEYVDSLYESYASAYGDENQAVYKLKEVWFYLGNRFPEAKKELKKIRKASTPDQYRAAVEEALKTVKGSLTESFLSTSAKEPHESVRRITPKHHFS